MAEVYDDVVRFHKENPDSLDLPLSRLTGSNVHGADIFEIVIDADHGAERVVGFSENDERELRYRSAFTQNYHLYMPPLNGYTGTGTGASPCGRRTRPGPRSAWSFPGSTAPPAPSPTSATSPRSTTCTRDGPEQSVLHDLQEDAVIGLAWSFIDATPATPPPTPSGA